MTFNKTELKQLLRAIAEAIETGKGLIDAHCTEFQDVPNGYLLPKVPPKQSGPLITRLQREIKQWRKLRIKICGGLDETST